MKIILGTLMAIVLLLAATAVEPVQAAELESYSGTVVDGETGQPLTGATVVVSWGMATPTPAGAVGGFLAAAMDETDNKGTYRIPGRTVPLPLPSYVDGVTFLAYQPGYAGFAVTYYDGTAGEETRRIRLRRLTGSPADGQFHDEFEHGISRIDPHVDESDPNLTPQMRINTLVKGVPERDVLRARSDWERLFRREE
jgi:hypothetical protein